MEKKEYTAKNVSSLLKAIENDCSNATLMRSKISRLNLEARGKIAKDTKTQSRGVTIAKKGYESVVDSDFEDEILFYLYDFNKLADGFSLQDVIDILPGKDDYNYLRIIYRLQCEIIKNIKSIIEAAKNDKDFLELLPLEERKLQALKDVIELEEEKNVEDTCNKIILVPNLSGNISIIDDVEHLPYDVYDDVLELINSIIDGTFKRNKWFTHINDLSGICEVRKGDLRVIYTRITTDTYAILTAFLKKMETDQYYRDNLNRKANNYRAVEKMLRDNLDNSDFIRENDLQVQRLFSILKRDDDAKVFRKGDINE